jgi:hypothetical protein
MTTLDRLRPEGRGTFDGIGTGLLAGWVAALMFPLVEVTEAGWGWTDGRTLALFITALVLFVAFVYWELRITHPLVPLRQFGRRIIASIGGLILLNSVIAGGLTTLLSIYVGIVLLHDGPNATTDVRDMLYWIAVPLILGAVTAGQLLTRLPYRTVIAPAVAISAVGGYFLTQVTATTPLWVLQWGFLPVGGLALPLIPMGFGTGVVLSGAFIVVQNESPAKELGASMALATFLRNLGGAVGLSLLTAFQEWRFNATAPSPPTPSGTENALVASYQDLFWIVFVLVLLSLGFALLLRGRIPAASDKSPSVPESGADGDPARTPSGRGTSQVEGPSTGPG